MPCQRKNKGTENADPDAKTSTSAIHQLETPVSMVNRALAGSLAVSTDPPLDSSIVTWAGRNNLRCWAKRDTLTINYIIIPLPSSGLSEYQFDLLMARLPQIVPAQYNYPR